MKSDPMAYLYLLLAGARWVLHYGGKTLKYTRCFQVGTLGLPYRRK